MSEKKSGNTESDSEKDGSGGHENREISEDKTETESERVERLGSLHEATRNLMQAETPEEVAEKAVEAARDVIGLPLSAIHFVNEENTLKPVASTEKTEEILGRIPDMRVEESLAGDVFKERETGIYENVSDQEKRFRDDTVIESEIILPLGDYGTLTVGSTEKEEFTEFEIESAKVLASNTQEALKRAKRESDLRKREDELVTERDRFSALFENIVDPAVRVVFEDGEPYVKDVNRSFEEVFGYTEEEIKDESLNDYVVPKDQESEAKEIDRTAVTGKQIEKEVKRKTVDWIRHFLFRGIPLEVGEVSREGFGIYTDITDRKTREESLNALHEATRELMQANRKEEIARICVEVSKKILGFSMATVRFYDEDNERLELGAATQEAKKEIGEKLSSSEEGKGLQWKAFESGEVEVYEDISENDDSTQSENSIKSLIHVPLGEHGVLAIGSSNEAHFDTNDVNLAKILGTNAETALDRTEREEELRKERNRISALFENTTDCIAEVEMVDGEPLVRRVNRAFEDVFGVEEKEIKGENIDDIVVPRELDEEAERINEEIERKLEQRESFEAEVKRETPDGLKDFILRVVPLKRDEEEKINFGVYTDITERKQKEKELEKKNERLEEFASVVSHDLRNPLNVAQGYLEMAQEKGEGDEEYLEKTKEAHDRMTEIVENVLELARKGESIGEKREIDLNNITESAWENVNYEDAELVNKIEDEEIIEADPQQLKEAIENLFRNAVEHGEEGVTVTVARTQEGFCVKDDGPGIPENERDEIFKSGYTTSEEGTGFGLSIVERIIEAHGWEIEVRESEEGGAKFEVVF